MAVYKATNKVNNKVYIGATTTSLHQRKVRHKIDAYRKDRRRGRFQEAIVKYGIDSFIFEELYVANSKEDMYEKEKMYIKEYNSTFVEKGYNLDSGGIYTEKNESTKKLISDVKKESWSKLETKENCLLGLKKGHVTMSKQYKERRIVKKCEQCGEEFEVIPCLKDKKKFCSKQCSNENRKGKHVSNDGAIEGSKKKYVERKKLIAEDVRLWAFANKDTVLSCPSNKIAPSLSPLVEMINTKYGISDIRSIAKSFTGKYGNKNFLNELKSCVKIYAGLV